MKPTAQKAQSRIADNKKARFDYKIEESLEAGLALEGWEVKSLRAGRAQITESYVHIRDGEAWLLGARIAHNRGSDPHSKAIAPQEGARPTDRRR